MRSIVSLCNIELLIRSCFMFTIFQSGIIVIRMLNVFVNANNNATTVAYPQCWASQDGEFLQFIRIGSIAMGCIQRTILRYNRCTASMITFYSQTQLPRTTIDRCCATAHNSWHILHIHTIDLKNNAIKSKVCWIFRKIVENEIPNSNNYHSLWKSHKIPRSQTFFRPFLNRTVHDFIITHDDKQSIRWPIISVWLNRNNTIYDHEKCDW